MTTKYNIISGMITTIEMGVVTRITIIVPSKRNNITDVIRNILGNLSSKISKSLLKRFIIRPTGVVSKKAIGDRKTHSKLLS